MDNFYEQLAVARFTELTGKEIHQCGLFVDQESPFPAATPDGIVAKENALLKVKCPFKGRDSRIEPGDKFKFLESRKGELKLKKKHSYFFQVQGQLKICKRKTCYFVTYTFADIFIEEIEYDAEFYSQKMFPHLASFYKNHFLPCVASSL
jgi:hypothetical protein